MKILLTGYLLFYAFIIQGQDLRLVASVQEQEVEKNAVFRVSFQIDAIAKDFDLPKLENFDLVAGPSLSTNRSYINGKMSSSTVYSITLLARKEGTFTLPPATVNVKGKSFQSNSLNIKVTKAKSLEDIMGSGSTFVRMEISDTTAYPGQRLKLDYVIYTKKDISGFNFVSQDEFQGFHQESNKTPRGYKKILVGSETYYMRKLYSFSLFPQKTGKFNIDPFTISVATPLPHQSRSFFVQTERQTLTSNELQIIVQPLPANAPPSFSGAVGKFDMSAKLLSYDGKVGEASLMHMTIEGTGDQKFWNAPTQEQAENLEYYDPKVIDERMTTSEWGQSSYKKIEYLIVPQEVGNYPIRPKFTYFDTDSLRYITLDAGPYMLQVKEGSNEAIETDLGKSSYEESNEDEEKTNSWLWLIPIVTVMVVSGIYILRAKNKKETTSTKIDVEEDRKRRAEKIALEALSTAKNHADKGEEGLFYTELSLALNKYLGDKFNLLSSDLNVDTIIRVLKRNNVTQDKIDEYISIMKKCELALYAKQSQADMKETYHRASTLIKSMVQ